MNADFRRSPLALAILGLLENGPLHPYGMQRLIKQWGKDQVVNVGQRASLYKVIGRLCEAGLIRARGTSRDQQYPERTSYELTDAGRAAARQWMADMLSTPRNEFPEFPAALSFLPLLSPGETADLLGKRRELLAAQLAEHDSGLAAGSLPRVVTLEDEYQRAATAAELGWVQKILAELADGSLTWDQDELRTVATRYLP